VKKKHAQVTFTVTNGPVDGTTDREEAEEEAEQAGRQRAVHGHRRPADGDRREEAGGRYDLALTAAGQTLTAIFCVR
jgi:hypothetical protein